MSTVTLTSPSTDTDTDTDEPRGRRAGEPNHHLRTPKVSLFFPEEPTPCQDAKRGSDWFGEKRGERERAMKACGECPFRGRCAYNAVGAGATHGVWGGIELPGDRPMLLQTAYARLLSRFEERRAIEVGSAYVAPLTDDGHYRRRPSAA